MSDSLISGQPLYRLYSKFARATVLSRLRATQAMGSVRLQVTGNPATVSVSSRARERRLLRNAFQFTFRDMCRALIPAVQAPTPRRMRRDVFMPQYLSARAELSRDFE